MTRQVPLVPSSGGTWEPGTGWADAHQGRLRLAFRIGVTGHRRLANPDALIPAVQAAIRGMTERFLGQTAAPALLVISALAEGADRLVVREVLARPAAGLEAVLPLSAADYLNDFPESGSKAEFTELLGQAAAVWQAPPGSSREEAYEWAGRRVVDRCDALIALWDGAPSRGRGGTATIVEYARDQGVPVAWVPTSGPAVPVYWYDRDRAARVEEAVREFREYNAPALLDFPARCRAEWERLAPPGASPAGPGSPAGASASAGSLRQACASVAGWIVPYFVRADALASRLERGFTVTNWAMFLAAAAAVVIVASQVTFAPHLIWIDAAEVILLLLLVVAPLVSRRRRVLDRWISYRFLAERLRSGYFLGLAGAVDRAAAADHYERLGYLADPTELWIQRALEEVMARRPPVRIRPADVAPLRDYLSERWIGAQIRYHTRSARRHAAWDSRLFAATGILFLVTAVAAVLRLAGLGTHGGDHTEFGLLLIVLSICVPAVGAAVHGIRTQSEFRRHAQRYERMASLLRRLQADLRAARSIESIHAISVEAERLMRAENSDWFGVMRFHDVELIT